jgi:hypothetical protein
VRIADIFETRVEEKIEPVIKVGELQDEAKLAAEIGSYVVTPTIEKYVDEFLEHFTDSFFLQTTEVGTWISGYFGSGKSHLAKVLTLLVENRNLQGHPAAKRFEGRVPANASRRASILRSLSRLDQCATSALAFNLNTLVDSRKAPLPRLLLSQYYQSRGYSSNLLYARVIEQELDRRGKLGALHHEAAKLAETPWMDISKNPTFYGKHLYRAASNIAPDVFAGPDDVIQALKVAESGDLYNVRFLVETMLDDLRVGEQALKKPCRMLLVLDESGQWIEDDASRLAQLQAFVEEAAIEGQGKLWISVTTHEDMGAVFQNARALQADMKKIEGRFRFKFSLTTENIELVLEDRILKKKIVGRDAVGKVYDSGPGALRGLGELANVSQKLPDCDRDRFVAMYPFFPYEIHLIPEIVKSLRSKGGRGEQLSGSTRTLLAITQDVLRVGRRPYLKLEVGEVVSFDEIYSNLAGEAEVSPDVRRELARIEEAVPGATSFSRRTAEALFLIGEIAYVPRTVDNVARLLAESTSDDLPGLVARIQPELDRLIAAKMVARIGDEYEFLTGARRTFEDEVATVAAQLRQQDREAGLAKYLVYDPEKKANHLRGILGFETVPYMGAEFDVRLSLDGTYASKNGHIDVRIFSPQSALGGVKVTDLEDQSLRDDERNTIFVLCDRIPGFDQELNRFLAMREVVNSWKGDPHRSEEARELASHRETNDLVKLERTLRDSVKLGLKQAHVIFKGSSRAVLPRAGQTPGEVLRAELSSYWPTLYPKFEKVPVRIVQEQRAISDVLAGEKNLAPDVKALRLFDNGGAVDPHSPLLDAVRIFLASRQSKKERTLGKDLLTELTAPPYGWDANAVRVGVAAYVRASTVKILIGKMPHTQPTDPTLQKALRDSREFEKVELVLEEAEIDVDTLEQVRSVLMKLTGKRKLDETPAVLYEAMEIFGKEKLATANRILDWANPAGLPLPRSFVDGKETLEKVLDLASPMLRVKEINARAQDLGSAVEAIDQLAAFREKWSAPFIDLRNLATQLRAIEHLLPPMGATRRFLTEYEAAKLGALFGEPTIWKSIQQAKSAAELEVQTLLQSWREEARQIVKEALERLPSDLSQRNLPAELAKDMAVPMNAFCLALDTEVEPSRVASLPERARRLAGGLGEGIRKELENRAPKPPGGEPPKPAREIRRVRVSDIATIRRVQTEVEWEGLQKKLDQHVRALLRDFDVELD